MNQMKQMKRMDQEVVVVGGLNGCSTFRVAGKRIEFRPNAKSQSLVLQALDGCTLGEKRPINEQLVTSLKQTVCRVNKKIAETGLRVRCSYKCWVWLEQIETK